MSHLRDEARPLPLPSRLAPTPGAQAPTLCLGWTEADTRPSDIEPPLLNPVQAESVRIGPQGLPGLYETVERALGVVVFVHGPGGSAVSPRSAAVACVLHRHGLSTLRLDPERAGSTDPDDAVDRTAARVGHALAWVLARHPRERPRLGLLGVGAGAAAALRAVASERGRVDAVVLRGGRVDRAADVLADVTAPTLMIVGERDEELLASTQRSLGCFGGLARVAVVPGAGHRLEQPGALELAARWSAEWFAGHLDDGWDRLAADN